MKYLKKFESEIDSEDKLFDEIKKKASYYKDNYQNKFVIMKYYNEIYLAKIIRVASHAFIAKIDFFEWDDYYQGYSVDSSDAIHINEFVVLDSFDNIKNAKEAYDIMITAKKYNI